MAIEVLMPKLGLTMEEGTIEEWKVKVGDTVKKGDIIFIKTASRTPIPPGAPGVTNPIKTEI